MSPRQFIEVSCWFVELIQVILSLPTPTNFVYYLILHATITSHCIRASKPLYATQNVLHYDSCTPTDIAK